MAGGNGHLHVSKTLSGVIRSLDDKLWGTRDRQLASVEAAGHAVPKAERHGGMASAS
jgi:hypothetical protein